MNMQPEPPRFSRSTQVAIVCGILLIIFGLYKVLEKFVSFGWWESVRSVFSTFFFYAWPIALIVAGIFLVWAARTGKLKGFSPATNQPLRRSITDKRISGLCGGIARYFGIDPTIVRVLAVILLVVSFPVTLLAYIIASVIIPR
jgi:phage shock protein PspC (stress-responsive transcriptional regulator)